MKSVALRLYEEYAMASKLPFYAQEPADSCGLACLRMALGNCAAG
jgi:hypothetical protein